MLTIAVCLQWVYGIHFSLFSYFHILPKLSEKVVQKKVTEMFIIVK